jgi:hypothetical protein
LNLKINGQGKVAEENFGTVGAIASAFVCGFPPRTAVKIKKSADNSGRRANILWSHGNPIIEKIQVQSYRIVPPTLSSHL